jgi:hypothetical protein
MRSSSIAAFAFAIALLVIVCGTSPLPSQPRPEAETDREGAAPAVSVTALPPTPARTAAAGETPPNASPCPDDMVYVDTIFCPDVERRCIDMEQEKTNHLPICHAFAHEQRCHVPERRIAFCIDRYEYPNRRGGHPVWMLDWYQAQASCGSLGKRLCWASEWTAACEGPERTPFPYGWARNHNECNIDNFYVEPKRFGPKGGFYFESKDPGIRARELARLDQSVPSGSMESCKSGFGVYDMTGNFDEWVTSDVAPREASHWAGLKGGAWGHVRSQCRPMTFSHEPGFEYYFVGFRCCSDVPGAPKWVPSPDAASAPAVEPHDFATEAIEANDAPGPSRTKFSRSGRVE